ncbi:MAG: class I SAM-dependent methyltransferase [Gammaproteobacteria bacterium]|nr:class I SAM-dependent methyltransferase [Gammaproteobacteria bacterium]
MSTHSVSVRYAPGYARCRRQLAVQLDALLAAAGAANTAAPAEFHIEFDRHGAALRCAALPCHAPYQVSLNRARAGPGAADPLRKAIGARAATVIDATAGWGTDAARLAGWGYRVTAVEKHPLVAALLLHAHAQCRDADLRARLKVVHGDSAAYLGAVACAPDVVYLDPMYPPNPKSAAAKKPLALLRRLAGPPGDNRALFEAALACARRRVVVKRPHRAPPLDDRRVGEIAGKLVRFDIYKPAAA